MSGDVLAAQLADARRRVALAREQEDVGSVRSRALATPAPPSFLDALAGPGTSVIAEVKRASPSRGPLAPDLDPAGTARSYLEGGAAAVSVLTAPQGFLGSLDDLRAVVPLGAPVLRKDFVVDPLQVWEARAAGASAVLLLVVALDDAQLGTLLATATEAGLDALVEVHDEAEMVRAARLEPRIVGVNVRDLRDFRVENERFARVAGGRPSGALLVAESGVHGPDDVRAYARAGADAVLVGEHLVTSDDPSAATMELVAAGSPVGHAGSDGGMR